MIRRVFIRRALTVLIALCIGVFPSFAEAANKFWTGGTGSLDGVDTAHISDTSGGAGGASYPAAGDSLTFDAASGGGTVTFTAALSITTLAMGAFTGTIDTNDQDVTVSGTFSISGSGTRTIRFGSSTISCTVFTAVTTTGLTFDAETSTLVVAGGGFSGGGLTYNTVQHSGTTASLSLDGANTFGSYSYTITSANKTGALFISANQTITNLVIAGNSSVNRVLIRSSVKGTARTITAANVTASNADFQDITGAGAGDWDLSAISGLSGDCGGNSGITFTSPVTNYWIGGTGNADAVAEWASSSGGASSSGRVPLPQDAAVVDGNSGTGTITQNMTRTGSWDFTGSSGITWTTSTVASFFGSIDLTDLGTLTNSTQTYTYEGRGASTLDFAGKSVAKTLTLDCVGGSLTLASSLSIINGTFNPVSGTFDANDFSFTFGILTGGSFTGTVYMGSGDWIQTSNSNPWSMGAGATVHAETSTIRLTAALTVNRTFSGGGKTYNNLIVESTGAFEERFAGSNTFNNFHIDASAAARTVLFAAGTTTTVASMTRDAGTNVITLGSITAASHALAKSGGGVISGLDYLSVSRSDASPASTWYAGANSTDGSNNTGWIFTAAPSSGGCASAAGILSTQGMQQVSLVLGTMTVSAGSTSPICPSGSF